MKTRNWKCLLLIGCFLVAAFAGAFAQDSCEKLAAAKISAATITLAQTVAAGGFAGPAEVFSGRDMSAFYKKLPAFCRVVAEAKPTSDSDIKLEVWLPASGWNGKLQGIGNGGFAGLIDYVQIANAMSKGYAATERIRATQDHPRSMRTGRLGIRRKWRTLGIAEFTR